MIILPNKWWRRYLTAPAEHSTLHGTINAQQDIKYNKQCLCIFDHTKLCQTAILIFSTCYIFKFHCINFQKQATKTISINAANSKLVTHSSILVCVEVSEETHTSLHQYYHTSIEYTHTSTHTCNKMQMRVKLYTFNILCW